MANFWLLCIEEQSHPSDVNNCAWAINIRAEGDWKPHNKVGFLVECSVEFEPGNFQFDCCISTHLAAVPTISLTRGGSRAAVTSKM